MENKFSIWSSSGSGWQIIKSFITSFSIVVVLTAIIVVLSDCCGSGKNGMKMDVFLLVLVIISFEEFVRNVWILKIELGVIYMIIMGLALYSFL